MRKVIYTCLTGNYDDLKQPLVSSSEWDYICFSDCLPEGVQGCWEIRRIPKSFRSSSLASRYPKILPHRVLPEYDWSLYIDANLQISSRELYEIVDRHIANNDIFCQVPHPFRDCIYDELSVCYIDGKIGFPIARRINKQLHEAGFPRHAGLNENNIILRCHNHKSVMTIGEEWWQLFNSGQRRDQLSLRYILWKNHLSPVPLLGDGINTRNSSCISFHSHSKQQSFNSFASRKILGTLARMRHSIRQRLATLL